MLYCVECDWLTDHCQLNAVNRFPQLQFQYKDPERGFDRRSVHGPVAKLITVKDPATAMALEVSAGGKVNVLAVVYAEVKIHLYLFTGTPLPFSKQH